MMNDGAATSIDVTPFGGARVIVLLGCVARLDPRDDLGLRDGAARRRVRAAAEAYARVSAEGGAPVVIASGGRAWDGVVEADALRDALVRSGVPASSVVRERCSFSTKENARYVSCLLYRRGDPAKVLLVTCRWHVPRAQALFEREGISVLALPVGAPVRGGIGAAWERAYRRGREHVAAAIDEVTS